MKRLKITILFLIINFIGLAIGNWFMNDGPSTNWYINLNKAPWNPPGWVFGFAWTLIMVTFSIYLGKLLLKENTFRNRVTFLIQFLLNVSWNFIFFNKHWVFLGLINLILLTSLIFIYFFKVSSNLQKERYLLLPYALWLCVATSLNLYILIHN